MPVEAIIAFTRFVNPGGERAGMLRSSGGSSQFLRARRFCHTRFVWLEYHFPDREKGKWMDGNPFQDSPAGDRSDAIAQLYGAECAIRQTLLRVVAAHDEAESWREDGATSMTSWLVAQLGIAHGTAARMVSAGHALEDLPHVARAFGEGRLSWDKARTLSDAATPATDQTLTEQALGLSAAQVQTLTRRLRASEETEANRSRRSVRKWWDRDGQWFNLRARIPGSDGAIVEKAIERAVRQVPRSAHGQIFEPLEMRQADALVEIASTRLGTDPDPDRSSVVVHVDSKP